MQTELRIQNPMDGLGGPRSASKASIDGIVVLTLSSDMSLNYLLMEVFTTFLPSSLNLLASM